MGTTVPPYNIFEKLGGSGMRVVFKAYGAKLTKSLTVLWHDRRGLIRRMLAHRESRGL